MTRTGKSFHYEGSSFGCCRAGHGVLHSTRSHWVRATRARQCHHQWKKKTNVHDILARINGEFSHSEEAQQVVPGSVATSPSPRQVLRSPVPLQRSPLPGSCHQPRQHLPAAGVSSCSVHLELSSQTVGQPQLLLRDLHHLPRATHVIFLTVHTCKRLQCGNGSFMTSYLATDFLIPARGRSAGGAPGMSEVRKH